MRIIHSKKNIVMPIRQVAHMHASDFPQNLCSYCIKSCAQLECLLPKFGTQRNFRRSLIHLLPPSSDPPDCPSTHLIGSEHLLSLDIRALTQPSFDISPDRSVFLRYPHLDQCASELPSVVGTGALLEVCLSIHSGSDVLLGRFKADQRLC